MKKLLGIVVLGLLLSTNAFAETLNELFGLKLGKPIDQSIIINEVKEMSDDYIYLKFHLSLLATTYQVEPPMKNKIFSHYFVRVYPISKKIYKIYAYRDSWDKKYNGERICEQKTESQSSIGVYDVDENGKVINLNNPSKCKWTNPETPIQLKKISKLNNQYFKALEKYLAEKYDSVWQDEFLDNRGFIYMDFNENLLSLSSPNQIKLKPSDIFAGIETQNAVEFGILLEVKTIDDSEFEKLLKDKEEKKIEDEKELYNKILDKTGL